jgi:excisionase family DNA binding protein
MTRPVTWSLSAQAALERLDGKLFATTTETAVILNYDSRTVRAAIEAGEIPSVRAGSTYRVPVAWIREQARLGSESAISEAPGIGTSAPANGGHRAVATA